MAGIAAGIAAETATEILNYYAMLLASLKRWSPFRIDALGVMTMLGAPQVDRAVGRLIRSRYADFLQLLGAFTLATNQITEPIPGSVLYDITDGILAIDLTRWFSRWLLCQKLTYCSTTITISEHKQRRPSGAQMNAIILGTVTLGFLIIISASIGDWWGFANSVFMVVSVAVRHVLLNQNKSFIDRAVEKDSQKSAQLFKVFLTLPIGNVVSIVTSRGIVTSCLLTTPRPTSPRVYQLARALGWLMFGVHVVSLGMSTLFIQLLSVCLLLVATVLVVVRKVGDNESRIGSRLLLRQSDAAGENEFRAKTYARLNLTEKEENSMVQWNLFPQEVMRHGGMATESARGIGEWRISTNGMKFLQIRTRLANRLLLRMRTRSLQHRQQHPPLWPIKSPNRSDDPGSGDTSSGGRLCAHFDSATNITATSRDIGMKF